MIFDKRKEIHRQKRPTRGVDAVLLFDTITNLVSFIEQCAYAL